jgi:hypothetical protein
MSEQSSKLFRRREALQVALATGTAAVVAERVALGASPVSSSAAPTASAAPAAPATVPAAPVSASAVQALFGSLRPGARVGRWTVVAIHEVRLGAIPVQLATADGDTFQVDVHRRDEDPLAPSAPANTPSLSLYLVNNGVGSTATHEEHGLGAMALADALAEREAAGAPVPALLTLRQRTAYYPGGVFAVVG